MAERDALGFVLEEGAFGACMVVTSAWTEAAGQVLRERDIPELVLNYARGWQGKDVAFLAGLARLKALTILHWTIDDISPIHHLTELQSINISTYCKTAINFDTFPALRHCALVWRPKAASLFRQTALETLFLDRHTGKDCSALGGMTGLCRLSLASAPVASLADLRRLTGLQQLGLFNLRKLVSVEGIGTLERLEALEIDGCHKLGSLDPLSGLEALRRLQLNDLGEIASLRPLAGLRGLREVLFAGSTNVLDGDLSPLVRPEAPIAVAFQERRHYSHRRTDFPPVV